MEWDKKEMLILAAIGVVIVALIYVFEVLKCGS